ncbi:MAG TPA: type IV toxin-antitoxin system AbiEi family antitoxin domain-containing protein [Solirubrobacteraceae bacterium]|nr:type IV toxin-antitoxin system AbiEi family antitoxin domain-containing protein [Solirubrobacteraceae bacterium]
MLDALIAEIASRQRGYVTRRQLLDAGLGSKAIDYRIKIGRLIPVHTGVYAVGHLPTLPQDRAVGALLACGKGAVLSHGSAASLWGVFRRWEMPFEVTARTVHRRAGIRVHRAALVRADITTQLGVRVTSPAHTVLDIAPRVTDKTLARAVNELRIARHLVIEELDELLERCPRHPGARRLIPFVATADNATRSKFERDFLTFAERFGLPRPHINVWLAGREVDAYFAEERVIVELDGYEFHSSKDTFRSDRDHDAEALALDILTVRITLDRLEASPEKEAERLHRILELRRRRAA